MLESIFRDCIYSCYSLSGRSTISVRALTSQSDSSMRAFVARAIVASSSSRRSGVIGAPASIGSGVRVSVGPPLAVEDFVQDYSQQM
ncbi:MAG: hypothetical protein CM1200mP39_17320 [Dehalococcoidia bacterium]|nr:MAG: hypothetical protein CM1200mP39_17320 [Dehalococcoidia bacterium]